MVRPVNFSFNVQTAANNAFQVKGNDRAVHDTALKEFDQFVKTLSDAGVEVQVVDDSAAPETPDSIFPNNWVSFHAGGSIVLYPMFAENRRAERKQHVIDAIARHFLIARTIDMTGYEHEDLFLEGTGSMVLDREHKLAFACLSPRTSRKVLQDFCTKLGYEAVTFSAVDQRGVPIYHTNVMMCIADRYAVVCLDTVSDPDERNEVARRLTAAGKAIVEITFEQLAHFAGNMLQVENKAGEKLLIMSSQAYESLSQGHREILERYNRIVHSSIGTIEANGGGSARCMMAEVHLPVKKIEK